MDNRRIQWGKQTAHSKFLLILTNLRFILRRESRGIEFKKVLAISWTFIFTLNSTNVDMIVHYSTCARLI